MPSVAKNDSAIAVIWSSCDKEIARNIIFNYAINARTRDWWTDVHLMLWGPSLKLVAKDTDVQNCVREMMELGINVSACTGRCEECISSKLRSLGITVSDMEEPVREMLKRGAKVITF